MVGVAVNVTLVPEQMLVALAPIFTEGATDGLTVIVMAFEVAVGSDTHVSEEVITTKTTSPFTNDAFW